MSASIWQRLGDVANYIEPFCGSAAVLLARPTPPKVETLNDADAMLANFWRATSRDPDAVAGHADGPVNEADLHARHRWLVLSDEAKVFRERMRTDPDYYDPKIAGWWCWGLCCWIGSGWCQDRAADWQQAPYLDEGLGRGVNAKRPRVPSSVGGAMPGVIGLHQQRPRVEMCQTGGIGVHGVVPSDGNRPQLADAFARGRGVHGNDDAGTCAERRAWLLDWFGRLRDRLRPVRVCCGHWLRVCDSHSVTTRLGTTGVFLDPPYAHDAARMNAWVAHIIGDGPEPASASKATNRSAELYANDRSQDVDRLVADVQVYCRVRGADPEMRIVLAGYEGEHDALEGLGWECVAWKAGGGYGSRSTKGRENAGRERLWVSPHCENDFPLFANRSA